VRLLLAKNSYLNVDFYNTDYGTNFYVKPFSTLIIDDCNILVSVSGGLGDVNFFAINSNTGEHLDEGLSYVGVHVGYDVFVTYDPLYAGDYVSPMPRLKADRGESIPSLLQYFMLGFATVSTWELFGLALRMVRSMRPNATIDS